MLGIAAPLLIKGKVAMRDLFVNEAGLDWDTILPDYLQTIWVSILSELVQAGKINTHAVLDQQEMLLSFG